MVVDGEDIGDPDRPDPQLQQQHVISHYTPPRELAWPPRPVTARPVEMLFGDQRSWWVELVDGDGQRLLLLYPNEAQRLAEQLIIAGVETNRRRHAAQSRINDEAVLGNPTRP